LEGIPEAAPGFQMLLDGSDLSAAVPASPGAAKSKQTFPSVPGMKAAEPEDAKSKDAVSGVGKEEDAKSSVLGALPMLKTKNVSFEKKESKLVPKQQGKASQDSEPTVEGKPAAENNPVVGESFETVTADFPSQTLTEEKPPEAEGSNSKNSEEPVAADTLQKGKGKKGSKGLAKEKKEKKGKEKAKGKNSKKNGNAEEVTWGKKESCFAWVGLQEKGVQCFQGETLC
jgi:hypothetical protein